MRVDRTLVHFPHLHHYFIFFLPPVVLHSNQAVQYKTDKQEVGVYLLTRALNLGTPSVLAIVFQPCVPRRIDRFRSHQRTMAPSQAYLRHMT